MAERKMEAGGFRLVSEADPERYGFVWRKYEKDGHLLSVSYYRGGKVEVDDLPGDPFLMPAVSGYARPGGRLSVALVFRAVGEVGIWQAGRLMENIGIAIGVAEGLEKLVEDGRGSAEEALGGISSPL